MSDGFETQTTSGVLRSGETCVVPQIKDYKEAVTFRKPIVEHKPKSAAAKATAVLADEFLARLDERIPDLSRRVA